MAELFHNFFMLALQCAWWKQNMICEKKWSDAYCAESTWQFTRPFDAPHICSLYHASMWYCMTVEILKNCSPSQYCNLCCCGRQLVSVRSCKNLYMNKIFCFFKYVRVQQSIIGILFVYCWWISTCFQIFLLFFSNILSIYLYLGISIPCLPNSCRE